MGRRALRKIDPQFDLTGYFIDAQQLTDAHCGRALFASPVPCELEVGSGKGLFLLKAAQAFPDVFFVGAEVSRKYARFAAARLAKAGAANARVLHADAQRVISDFVPDGRLQAVHVYFPDPWWKKRHHKRRIMNPEFVRQIERVLEISGRLHFWTDVQPYFDRSVQLIGQHTQLRGPFDVAEAAPASELDYRTHFERRMRLRGQPVFRAEFRRGVPRGDIAPFG